MDTTKLQLITYKSYSALCKILNEPIKYNTESKQIQLENWKRYFNYQKIEGTNKMQILEIFEEPKDDPKDSVQFEKLYQEAIFYNLFSYLLMRTAPGPENITTHIFMSKTDLAIRLGLYNRHYQKCKSDLDHLLDKLHIEITDLEQPKDSDEFFINLSSQKMAFSVEAYDFFKKSDSLVRKLLTRTTSKIHNSTAIHVKETYLISVNYSLEEIEASDEQIVIIHKERAKVLHSMGLAKLGGAVVTGRYIEFLKKVNQELLKYNIRSHRKVYRFAVGNTLPELYAKKYAHLFANERKAAEEVNSRVQLTLSKEATDFMLRVCSLVIPLGEL